ncbi:family 1 encapsulin nanocompartment shell protein [Proteiniborus sp. MB09-C3]|uniref:family 1 encapsulin nanocompartment shell protein n=1 Tax=Proteiniborus sp. MB09-C3 TaxID=3050072 RepID=UPI002552E9A9|nr:family 1 encapsulin nanocompartment shell protein [Proteiniborus sp. MB09-C3]WIV12647.1 family 1 encapsulin nanocompartment shell protein [Proteiniborus sp. MB09-C3]
MDFLLRGDAPFSDELWEKIDETVVKKAREQLVGRKFIPIFGPLGSGIQSINVDLISADNDSVVSSNGEEDTELVKVQNRRYVEIPMIFKDAFISWRDLENSKQTGLPLDLAPISITAAVCAHKEDQIVFFGNEEWGYKGLMNVDGRQTIQKNNWNEGENAFSDIVAGLEKLVEKGFYGPYALVLSPDLYAQLQRIQPGTGKLELERIRELIDGKVYQTPILGSNKAVLLEKGMENMDLVIGQDLVTGYIGPEKLNHVLRILETVLLRIKRPESIVTFE